jgi:hypothetical protein
MRVGAASPFTASAWSPATNSRVTAICSQNRVTARGMARATPQPARNA